MGDWKEVEKNFGKFSREIAYSTMPIDFLEPYPMCPRSEMVEWYTNPHTIQLLSCMVPDNILSTWTDKPIL
jgi:hypothetical protein